MKYRVVSVLKDNRPRFLIISDIEEIEILPSKYLKHLDQINASPNTVKSAAFALSYYYNYLQEQTIGLDEITLLSYSEQNKHFIDFLYWVKSGSKMRREKVIPVPSLLVGLVNDYEKKYGIKNGEYLFKNKKGGAFNGQTFSNQMIRECKARGIACGDYIFRAHDYRHNLATSMYGNGVSIQGVRDYLGHSSENMTKQYIDFMPERIVSAEDKYFSKNQSFKLKGVEDDER
ncbi:tyrosine-type recombinase/integrase [[Ruminococcus] torques]|uniref:tyrosine-type recombinase/integrase n=1 Tax=[Ruminococcus] torques TaxID=33039 RepID=UPI0006C1C927|nr:site-specific integrase [[Ruminococcus] torques]CUQ69716.1 site-specific tyrosine recombinase XerC [[Ruminococcus] torques]